MARPRPQRIKLKNPQKYIGDPTNVIARSSWEKKVMRRFDNDPNIIQWQSEETIVPYRSPKDKKIHRYFPDFVAKIKDVNGNVQTWMIEVKPLKETVPPTAKQGKSKKVFLNEVMTYGINDAKWKAARIFCEKRGWKFKVLTEKEIYGNK